MYVFVGGLIPGTNTRRKFSKCQDLLATLEIFTNITSVGS